ncbi:MAG TPA: beta-ketoacyl synthase N-terminal-like domain-containing protein [Methylomirabilota bacterium]|nr:beta-ketoacyl synthase N-terminal-like domain-containing protein [Methylomirabilota bacterium]
MAGVGLLTGWGEGPGALPAGEAEAPAALLPAPTPALSGERFRRATRECLLAVAAVNGAAAEAGLAPGALAGARTGLVYASATAYAAANRAFLEDEGSTTLHFPYTAPSAVPGEVTIGAGIQGPSVNLMGGGPAALQALWYAARWLREGVVDRVLVLAVETVHEVWDLMHRARRLYSRPIIEGAVCLLLEPGQDGPLRWASTVAPRARLGPAVAGVLDRVLEGENPRVLAGCAGAGGPARAEQAALARRCGTTPPTLVRAPGEALACGPLIGLALARARALGGPCLLTAAWRNDYGALLWRLSP